MWNKNVLYNTSLIFHCYAGSRWQMKKYFHTMHDLAERVMTICANGVNVDPTFVTSSLSDPFSAFRVAHYTSEVFHECSPDWSQQWPQMQLGQFEELSRLFVQVFSRRLMTKIAVFDVHCHRLCSIRTSDRQTVFLFNLIIDESVKGYRITSWMSNALICTTMRLLRRFWQWEERQPRGWTTTRH